MGAQQARYIADKKREFASWVTRAHKFG